MIVKTGTKDRKEKKQKSTGIREGGCQEPSVMAASERRATRKRRESKGKWGVCGAVAQRNNQKIQRRKKRHGSHQAAVPRHSEIRNGKEAV